MSSDPPSTERSPTDAEEAVCLVSHGPSKKIVNLTGAWKLSDLHESPLTGGFAYLMTGNDLQIQVDCHSWAEWAGVTKCMPTSLSRGPPLPSQPQRRLHGDGEEGSPLFSSLPHQWVTWVTGA
nr:uncharacterized protein LOC126538755 isoform X2 [Dermacentor andersoni]